MANRHSGDLTTSHRKNERTVTTENMKACGQGRKEQGFLRTHDNFQHPSPACIPRGQESARAPVSTRLAQAFSSPL